MLPIEALLKYGVSQGASDLHLVPGTAPLFRVNGQIVPVGSDHRVMDETEALVRSLLSARQMKEVETQRHLGFSFDLRGVGRFRVEAFFNMGHLAAAVRLSAFDVPKLEDLGTPVVLEKLCRKPNGLILVTGPTGSGKSTTLAAMVDLINRERRCKIVTVEDPIEYVHENKRSLIVQQEVHDDTPSFSTALLHVLRQDPDVVVVGEMRSLDTIHTALTAAETGHMVMATLHTSSAAQTINRIIDVFPPHQQNQVRIQVSSTLQAVISQRLLARVDGSGRVLAYEVLVNNHAVRNVIRENKPQQLPNLMQAGGGIGMCTMDSCIEGLYHSGVISYDTAIDHVSGDKLQRTGG